MIEFNLLPDVKIAYIKAERTKHAVIAISLITIAASLFVFSFLFLTVNVWQKKSINDLTGDIKTESRKLSDVEDLNKILTVQNQLKELNGLHDKKPVVVRLSQFIQQVTPTTATIATMNVEYDAATMSITGNAASLDAVNTFVDALKFTTYTTEQDGEQTRAFSNVVMTSFGRSTESATYTINLSFDPVIFGSESDSIALVVPSIITTRSVIEQPTNLFQGTGE